jgi:hypothetical protein
MSGVNAMRGTFSGGMFVVGLVAYAGAAFAQAPGGAEKVAAASSIAVDFGPVAGNAFNSSSVVATPFQDVLVTQIKPAGGKDLFVTVSMETGIFAQSQLFEQGVFGLSLADRDTHLQVRVLVDCADCAQPFAGRAAEPGIVNFDNLFRVVEHGTTAFDFINELSVQLGVRSFTFIARDVGVGVHAIRVQARFVAGSNSLGFNGFAFSAIQARIGTRTVTVEQVKLGAQ